MIRNYKIDLVIKGKKKKRKVIDLILSINKKLIINICGWKKKSNDNQLIVDLICR